MIVILKFDFQQRKQLHFQKKIIKPTQKRQNVTCDNYIFPKTRGKPRTSSGPSTLPLCDCLSGLSESLRLIGSAIFGANFNLVTLVGLP